MRRHRLAARPAERRRRDTDLLPRLGNAAVRPQQPRPDRPHAAGVDRLAAGAARRAAGSNAARHCPGRPVPRAVAESGRILDPALVREPGRPGRRQPGLRHGAGSRGTRRRCPTARRSTRPSSARPAGSSTAQGRRTAAGAARPVSRPPSRRPPLRSRPWQIFRRLPRTAASVAGLDEYHRPRRAVADRCDRRRDGGPIPRPSAFTSPSSGTPRNCTLGSSRWAPSRRRHPATDATGGIPARRPDAGSRYHFLIVRNRRRRSGRPAQTAPRLAGQRVVRPGRTSANFSNDAVRFSRADPPRVRSGHR